MRNLIACENCKRWFVATESGASVCEAGFDCFGEWDDRSGLCRNCVKEIDRYCDEYAKDHFEVG